MTNIKTHRGLTPRERRKLKPEEVQEIRESYARGKRGKGPKLAHIDLAIAYRVSTQVIHSVIHGKTYRDVPARKIAAA